VRLFACVCVRVCACVCVQAQCVCAFVERGEDNQNRFRISKRLESPTEGFFHLFAIVRQDAQKRKAAEKAKSLKE